MGKTLVIFEDGKLCFKVRNVTLYEQVNNIAWIQVGIVLILVFGK